MGCRIKNPLASNQAVDKKGTLLFETRASQPTYFPPHIMNTLNLAQQPSSSPPVFAAAKAPRSAQMVLRMLSKLSVGCLSVRLPTGEIRTFGSPSSEPSAVLQLNNWQLFSSVLKSGDIGFAESYIREDWSTESLVDVLSLLIANRETLEKAIYGTWLGRLSYRLKHLLNRNSKANAKKNIHAHYDIGNTFYSLWLDPSMTYSSALFQGDFAQSTQDAQIAKYQRVLTEIGALSGQHILEIGCGWGGFAKQAALAGLQVKGLTLSSEQLALAQDTLKQVNTPTAKTHAFVLQDYRDEQAQFDGIASIEMFEAVGEAFWPSYFATLRRCLKPQAKACVQTITIADDLFDRYRLSTDFIQQFIFPGGMLPSQAVFEAMAQKHGLKVINKHAFGLDYAHTLLRWRNTFMSRLSDVKAQGFDDKFIRTWEFYLAYCEAAFTHKNTDVVQYTLQRV
jgi:cyclopropane-fatty-acyl-phospholipid synthase